MQDSIFKNSFFQIGILFLLLAVSSRAQKGGRPSYPVLTKEKAASEGYVFVNNTKSLLKEIEKPGNRIFISQSFELTERVVIKAPNITISSDKKSVITSKLWFDKFRFYESFAIEAKNVSMNGLILKGDDCDIGTLDQTFHQAAIRCHSDSFRIVNCDITCFGWAAIYGHRYHGMIVEQCFISGNKNNGYGYGVWFEGKAGSVGMIQDCIFEDNRESVDAGGQLGAWTVKGCVLAQGITSHKNPRKQAGIGETIIDNYFIDKAGWKFPAPSVDTGWIIIRNNYFMRDSLYGVTGENKKARYEIHGNHYRGRLAAFPETKLSAKEISENQFEIAIQSTGKIFRIDFGDGSFLETTESTVVHQYPQGPGSYDVTIRAIDSRGVMGSRAMVHVVCKDKRIVTVAIKASSRFIPKGFYAVDILIDDSTKISVDAADVSSWKRFRIPVQSGRRKISVSLRCLQDAPYSCLLWIDDFDMNGQIRNSGFEDTSYYAPPYSNWRQKFEGNSRIGSGIDHREHASGLYAWRFEIRRDPKNPAANIIKAGTVAQLYQTIQVD